MNARLGIWTFALTIALVGCGGPKPETKTNPTPPNSTPESAPVTKVAPPDDPKFDTLVKSTHFYLTDEDEKLLGITGDDQDAIAAKAKKMLDNWPADDKQTRLEALVGDGSKPSDLAIAAAFQLPLEGTNSAALKQLLLEVPVDFANGQKQFQDAFEAWGDDCAAYFGKTKDKDILTALYTHDLDGAAGETVAYNRVSLALKHPDGILPLLTEPQLKNLGESLELGSDDLEKDSAALIALSKSKDPKLAKAASTVLDAYEATTKAP